MKIKLFILVLLVCIIISTSFCLVTQKQQPELLFHAMGHRRCLVGADEPDLGGLPNMRIAKQRPMHL